jgi:hypothetical protein
VAVKVKGRNFYHGMPRPFLRKRAVRLVDNMQASTIEKRPVGESTDHMYDDARTNGWRKAGPQKSFWGFTIDDDIHTACILMRLDGWCLNNSRKLIFDERRGGVGVAVGVNSEYDRKVPQCDHSNNFRMGAATTFILVRSIMAYSCPET